MGYFSLVKDSELRVMLATSEVAATDLLARSMLDQGSSDVVTETVPAGLLASLGAQRYINRLLWTELELDEDIISRTIDFFTSRNIPPSIQISSGSDSATTELLRRHGFDVDWNRSVLACRTAHLPGAPPVADFTVESVRTRDLDEWLTVLARGNGAESLQARLTSDEFGRAAHDVDGSVDLLARVGGRPAACGSLQPVRGVGWLGTAATVPEFRGRGLQRALIEMRIGMAGLDGHDFVAATAAPDSTSMRNLERSGLALVDTQTVWTRRP